MGTQYSFVREPVELTDFTFNNSTRVNIWHLCAMANVTINGPFEFSEFDFKLFSKINPCSQNCCERAQLQLKIMFWVKTWLADQPKH